MIEIIDTVHQTDFDEIQRIAYLTWPVSYGKILHESQIKYMLGKMYSKIALLEQANTYHHRFLLLKENNETVGFASYELNHKHLPSTKIHKAYILPELQGHGYGSLLFNKIASIAKENRNENLILNVNRQNPALQFYIKKGFNILREEDNPIGCGYWMRDFVMIKKGI